MLVEVGSSVDEDWLVVINTLIIESLSISLSLLHSKVAGGLATTLHSIMRVCCSSGVAVFPLISTSLAGTIMISFIHVYNDYGKHNIQQLLNLLSTFKLA